MQGACLCFLLCWTQVPGGQSEERKSAAEKPPPSQVERETRQEETPPAGKPLPGDLTGAVVEEDNDIDVIAQLRVGGWKIGGFDSLTPAGRRRVDASLLFDAGIDLRAELGIWSLAVTGDYGVGKDLREETGGLLVGLTWELREQPWPIELQFSAGPLLGRLDVNLTGFGNFSSSAGFEARICAVSWLVDQVGLSFWADYRQISFKYSGAVLSGDRRTGGSAFAVGAGLLMRF